MNGFTTLEAYEHWAPSYHARPHNPLMEAEQRAMLERCPPLRGREVLDLACGTGRYAALAASAGARLVVALDFAPGMIRRVNNPLRIRGDMSMLPLRAARFDVVLSGLALGHARDIDVCLRDVARVLRPGGTLLYSDFHPVATERGLRRGFRNDAGLRVELPADGHGLARHLDALSGAGFVAIERFDLRAGIEVRGDFDGAETFYREWHGTPLAFVMRVRKAAA